MPGLHVQAYLGNQYLKPLDANARMCGFTAKNPSGAPNLDTDSHPLS